jgi:hypothetical protein
MIDTAHEELLRAVRKTVLTSPIAVSPDEFGSHHAVAVVVPIEIATDLIPALAPVEGLMRPSHRQRVTSVDAFFGGSGSLWLCEAVRLRVGSNVVLTFCNA